VYGETHYLQWAIERYENLRHDLASSGIRGVRWSELTAPSEGSTPDADDPRVLAHFHARLAAFLKAPPLEVTPALGTSHALWGAYAALLSPGDELIVETPVYEPLVRMAEGMGVKVVYTERRAENGFELDFADVRARFSKKTRAVAITNLHNPTGVRTSNDAMADLARLCAENDAHLVVDEVYAPFASPLFDAAAPSDDVAATWPDSARSLGHNVVAIASLTKVYGAGPHRVGWIRASEDVTRHARNAMLASVGHLPWSHAANACTVLHNAPRLIERTRGELGRKRERVAAFMTRFPAWSFSAPEHGLFGFAWNPARRSLRADIEAWSEKTGALVVPGSFFGAETGFRMGWSLPEEKLDAALEKLAELLT
jgi:hypothetical protein